MTADVVFLFDVDNTLLDNDRVIADLHAHLDAAFGADSAQRYWTGFEAMASEARAAFPDQLAALADQDVELVPLEHRDFFPEAPGDQTEDA